MKSPFVCGNKPLLLWCLVVCLAQIGTARTWAAGEDNMIHLVAYPDPPYMIDQEGSARGLVIDVVTLLFKRTDLPFNIAFMPPKRALQTALFSKNHCVLAIERSQERESQFAWVSPLVISRHALYKKNTSKIELLTLGDARRYAIGSFLGSGAGEYLEGRGFNVDLVADDDLNLKKLRAGRIDLWATDTISVSWHNQFAQQDVELALVFLTTLRSMGCHLSINPDWIARLHEELLLMYKDGSINLIYEKYSSEGFKWLLNDAGD
ncbi:hypothetical protein BTA51_12780 [Hahella sp. CCB-MM4]|uniref:substrate-binding periplasmic protein n=1 Tax=Hahella sp. (strain CCB-MM4) TaxID=1926491 RepID=UPI000B9A4E29|nr:transporter substrate-binding domain-containing protein [Hahella sp. CCB-MM4]OZG72846.1 hypothetical protein BTA51_12780 [Hahella sp. CCB-MM4]